MGHVTTVGLWKRVLLATVLFVSATIALAAPAAAVAAPIRTGITIDGLVGDWAGIPSTTTTLIRPLATTERMVNGLEWKVAHDDANIYFLFLVNDDYDYNATNHDLSAAVAVLFQIDPAATPDMGGGNGNVDLWHWELDCGPGVLSGFNLMSGNDPQCNLDDEWANSTSNRRDDTMANELYGAWSHTNMTAPGATGKWVFEMKRSLTTADTGNQDYQFRVGTTAKMSFAYWDADETPAGWQPWGHYASCRDPVTLDFSWISIDLEAPPDIGALETQIDNLQGNLTDLRGDLADARSTTEATRTAANSLATVTYVSLILAVVALLLALVSMFRKHGKGAAPES